MQRLHVKNNIYTLVDDDIYEKYQRFKFRFDKNGYVIKTQVIYDENRKKLNRLHYLHHLVLPVRKGLYVDHINRNVLDNRRENLRYATPTQNQMNTPPRSKLGYKGVSLKKGLYEASINIEGKRTYLGCSKEITEAARMYNEAAVKHYKDFAWLNPV